MKYKRDLTDHIIISLSILCLLFSVIGFIVDNIITEPVQINGEYRVEQANHSTP